MARVEEQRRGTAIHSAVSFYDPSKPTSKPNAFAAIKDADKEHYNKSDLTDSEN